MPTVRPIVVVEGVLLALGVEVEDMRVAEVAEVAVEAWGIVLV